MAEIRRLIHHTDFPSDVESTTELSCYYCSKDFQRQDVKEVLSTRGGGCCYVCPHCGVDAVVPRSIRAQYTPREWAEAYTYWFGIIH
jgi:hypothetical protein